MARETTTDLARMLALSDGVFAFAMTVLALGLVVPAVGDVHSDADLRAALAEDRIAFAVYALSFFVIGIQWLGHHRDFTRIHRADRKLLWRNLGFLFTIAFLPFPTALLGRFAELTTAVVVYAASMVLVALLRLRLWRYAVREDHVHPDHLPHARDNTLRILYPCAVFAASIPVALWNNDAAKLVWVLVPFVRALPGARTEL